MSITVAEHNSEGKDAIKECYWRCKNGARNAFVHICKADCFAHVMSIIWYLGYAKCFPNDIRISSEHTNDKFVVLDNSNDKPSIK